MTVTAAETRVEYAGNGTTKVFSYPYQFFQNDDLDLWLFTDMTGVGIHQILGVDYTVTGAMNPSGGNVTMTVAPPSGTTLIIINDPDIVQTTHYVNADDFPADSHEQALDRLTKICQRLSDRIDRAVRAPDYAPEDQVPDADTLVGLVEDAQQAATEAAASADAAENAVNAASGSAVAAANSASAAAGSASSAAAAAAAAVASALDADSSEAGAAAAQAAAEAAAAAAQVAEVDWKGNWMGSTTYQPNDAVQSGGSSWISKTTNVNKDPATNPTDWDLLAQKGQPGAPGAGTGDMLGANNLSDVASVSQSRTNLGLGNAATKNVGTAANTVSAGDDARIVAAVQRGGDTMTGHLSLPTAPAAANAVRKDYVDAAIAAVPAPPAAATAAEYISNSAPTKMLTPGAVWTAAAAVTLSATPFTPDMATGLDFFINLNSATNVLNNPVNGKAGQKGVFYIQQGAAGGKTLTWGNLYFFPGGIKPTLSPNAGGIDIVSYVFSGTVYCCTFSAGFA